MKFQAEFWIMESEREYKRDILALDKWVRIRCGWLELGGLDGSQRVFCERDRKSES